MGCVNCVDSESETHCDSCSHQKIRVHKTIVKAEIEKKENGEYRYSYDGTTTGVSSGSCWGGCSSRDTYEEALKSLKNDIQKHNEWCDTYVEELDDGTEIEHREGEKYVTELFVNGKKVTFSLNDEGLNKWM